MAKVLDTTQAAMVGVSADRRDDIAFPLKLACEGCGVDVYVTKYLVEGAKVQCKAMGIKLQPVCRDCAQPFFEQVAAGNGSACGPAQAVAESMPDLIEARKRIVQASN